MFVSLFVHWLFYDPCCQFIGFDNNCLSSAQYNAHILMIQTVLLLIVHFVYGDELKLVYRDFSLIAWEHQDDMKIPSKRWIKLVASEVKSKFLNVVHYIYLPSQETSRHSFYTARPKIQMLRWEK